MAARFPVPEVAPGTAHVAPKAPAPTGASHADLSEFSARRLGPLRRYLVAHPRAMDLLVIAWFLLPNLLYATGSQDLAATARPVAIAGIAAASVALWWRRSRPLTVLAVVVSLTVVMTIAVANSVGLEWAIAFAVYSVAVAYPVRVPWVASLAAAAVIALVFLVGVPAPGTDPGAATPDLPWPLDETYLFMFSAVVGTVFLSVIALAIGTNVRARRLHLAALIDRANQLALERDQREQLAVVGERARIAREMHDVVAHSLSVMIALADGAAATAGRDAERALLAMAEVAETGRVAMTDMRRVVGALRNDDETAPLAPQPTAGLDDLVARFRAAGLPVRHTHTGPALPADSALRLTVYRLVQEALTNVLRHAPGTREVEVTVAREPGRVVVSVRNDGGAPTAVAPTGPGFGLIGMRERVAVLDGTLDAAPAEGGWRVEARLPWDESA